RGYELSFDESIPIGDLKRGAHLIFSLVHHGSDEALRIQTKERLVQGTWSHIALVYDGSGKASGLKLYVDGKPHESEVLRDSLSGSIQTPSPLQIGNKKTGNPYKGQMDDLRIYNRRLAAAEIENLAVHQPVRSILFNGGKRSKDQNDRLREYFLTYDAPEPFCKHYADLKRLTREKAQLDKIVPTTMVMQEMEKPRETFVLGR